MASPVKEVFRKVKPILSHNHAEARVRVLALYKAWIREARFIEEDYMLPLSEKKVIAKIRENFEKHRHVKDLRVIDMLVIKGQMELQETAHKWKTATSVMMYFKDTWNPKPSTFLGKFLSGQD